MIAFKNFTRTTFNLVLFLFSQWVTDRDLILGSNFSTLNTPYYRGKNKESNKKAPYNFGILYNTLLTYIKSLTLKAARVTNSVKSVKTVNKIFVIWANGLAY